jgi:hypothetical protein
VCVAGDVGMGAGGSDAGAGDTEGATDGTGAGAGDAGGAAGGADTCTGGAGAGDAEDAAGCAGIGSCITGDTVSEGGTGELPPTLERQRFRWRYKITPIKSRARSLDV